MTSATTANPILTAVIPTVHYLPALDEAIDSLLNLAFLHPAVIVNINSETSDFSVSKYWKDSRIKWTRNDKTLPLPASWNSAVNRAETEWVYIVSDDDIVLPHLLHDCNLSDFSREDIFVIANDTIDDHGRVLQSINFEQKETLSPEQALQRNFDHQIYHHASMMVFSKTLFGRIGGFRETGYPNGCYTDTVFHLFAFATASKIHLSKDIQFRRRVSLNQASAKFYWNGRDLDGYFRTIVSQLAAQPLIYNSILRNFRSLDDFRKQFQFDRFLADLYKLPTFYPAIRGWRFKLYLKFLGWQLPAQLKWKGICASLKLEKQLLRASVKRPLRPLKKKIVDAFFPTDAVFTNDLKCKAIDRLIHHLAWNDQEWYRGYMFGNWSRIQQDAAFLNGAISKTSPILDIGAVPPLLLDLLRQLGFSNLSAADPHAHVFSNYFMEQAMDFFDFDILRNNFGAFNGSFDCICLCEVIEHLSGNLITALESLSPLLNKGGYLFLTTPNLRSISGLFALVKYRSGLASKPRETVRQQYDRALTTNGYFGHLREFTEKEVLDLMKGLGYEHVKSEFQPRYYAYTRCDRVARSLEHLFPSWGLFGKYLFRKL